MRIAVGLLGWGLERQSVHIDGAIIHALAQRGPQAVQEAPGLDARALQALSHPLVLLQLPFQPREPCVYGMPRLLGLQLCLRPGPVPGGLARRQLSICRGRRLSGCSGCQPGLLCGEQRLLGL